VTSGDVQTAEADSIIRRIFGISRKTVAIGRFAAMNICSGKGFSSSESTSKTLKSASQCWGVYEPCSNASGSN